MAFRHFIILAIASLIGSSLALPTISAIGSKFYTSDGNQFFIKGVAYQLTPADPLIEAAQCKQDANLMQTLGTNSIRVYHVDPTQDHSACMSIFENAGIYLWLDLDTFDTQIVQSSPHWNSTQFAAFSAVMDSFQGFDNLAGFWIGNEVITTAAGSEAALYVKAAVHDMKAYRESKGYRNFPIGYSAADIAELRPMLQNYLACGNESVSVDFFGLNSYEWCGDVTYETSGYANLQAMSSGYNIPIFFSETGCNAVQPRTFADQAAIFGPDMIGTWSGSMIYEWIEEVNNYGLISYGATGSEAMSGTPVPIEPDFGNLKAQWQNISVVGIPRAEYIPSLAAPACPSSTPGGWLIDGNSPIPTLFGSVVSQTSSSPLSTSVIVPSMTRDASPSSQITSEPSAIPSIGVSSSIPVSSSGTEWSSASLPSLSSSSQPTQTATSAGSLPSSVSSALKMSLSSTSASSSSSTESMSNSSSSADIKTFTSNTSTSTPSAKISISGTPSPTMGNATPSSIASGVGAASTIAQQSLGSRIELNMFFFMSMALLTLC